MQKKFWQKMMTVKKFYNTNYSKKFWNENCSNEFCNKNCNRKFVTIFTKIAVTNLATKTINIKFFPKNCSNKFCHDNPNKKFCQKIAVTNCTKKGAVSNFATQN